MHSSTVGDQLSPLTSLLAAVCLWLTGSAVTCLAEDQATLDFDRQVAPVLASRCLSCHSGSEAKGSLDLSTREGMLNGGDSGAAVDLNNWEASLLWSRVRDEEMPPKHPLPESEKKLLRNWLVSGASWGTGPIDPFQYSSDSRAGYDWWSLQPLRRPEVPAVDANLAASLRNEIDAFILQGLQQAGLTPSPEAEPVHLARRLSYHLTGLPPTPVDVETLNDGESETAYLNFVERLLASEHYGERWARLWLDVARYGESQGFERDKLRTNAWPYRDWLIKSFNSDLPYDEFVRMQIAGDVLYPGNSEAVAATGFLVAGPYDEVGQKQQSEAMRKVVRQDEMEDIVGTVGQTFLGLTVNCGRCHDHKFDPILQEDYYRMVSALDGVRHGERPFRTESSAQELAALKARLPQIDADLQAMETPVREAILRNRAGASPEFILPEPVAHWDFSSDVGGAGLTLQGGARIAEGSLIVDGQSGYAVSPPLKADLKTKTLSARVTLTDLDQRGGGIFGVQTLDGVLFDSIVFGERDPGQWMAGSNGFVRTRSFSGPVEMKREAVHVAIAYDADGTIRCYRNGDLYGRPYKSVGLQSFSAGNSQLLIGLRHGTSAGGNRLLAGRIHEVVLHDRALSAEEVSALAKGARFVTEQELMAGLSEEGRQKRTGLIQEKQAVQKRISEVESATVYCVAPTEPEPTHLLIRGNPATPGKAVFPGGIACVNAGDQFGLAVDSPEGERRVALANWISSRENPLFARVIVNRVWQAHFGQGLVDSPNDFGFNGSRPSHPGLLDFLAVELIDHGYSLKWLQKKIVMSAAFRQSSTLRPDCLEVDAGNRLVWRKSPLRLDSEELRDSLLQISGQINRQVGGPPYRDFETFTFNSQFYEIIDPVTPDGQRRTLYRTWVRSGRNPLLDVFDCPDPSTTAPRRAMTVTPLQSLALLNNAFVLRMASSCEKRIATEVGEDPGRQIRQLWQLSLGRLPSEAELALVTEFTQLHGLAATCRVLWNSNEFLHIE